MLMGDRHLSQIELVRLVDGEVSTEQRERLESHIEICDACRVALVDARWTSEELSTAYGSYGSVGHRMQREEERLFLRKRLAHEGQKIPLAARVRSFLGEKLRPGYFYGSLAVAGAAALLLFVPAVRSSLTDFSASLPNRALTPGMTRPVSMEQVCSAEDEDLDPEVSSSTQQAVFQEYGISLENSAKDFQVDYLISPQLGGTDDVRNLWPQSYKVTGWNARAKDQLERHLSRLVCEKRISLAEAQHDIATNWIAAYQKYFHTSRPA